MACRDDELAKHGIQSSMSRRGDCYDNAFAESFFHTLKVELTHHRCYLTCEDARRDVADYIDGYYNPIRRHSSVGYESPLDYERRMVGRTAWWSRMAPIRPPETMTSAFGVPLNLGEQ